MINGTDNVRDVPKLFKQVERGSYCAGADSELSLLFHEVVAVYLQFGSRSFRDLTSNPSIVTESAVCRIRYDFRLLIENVAVNNMDCKEILVNGTG